MFWLYSSHSSPPHSLRRRLSGAYIGGGFEANGLRSAHDPVYGLALQAGYWRQFNRFGVRLGATYIERDRKLSSGPMERIRAVGANAEVSYDLTKSRFRPYLLGGLGLYRVSSIWSSNGSISVVDHVSPVITGGVGFRYRVGAVNLFMEARAHGFTSSRNCGCFVAPVTMGIQFD